MTPFSMATAQSASQEQYVLGLLSEELIRPWMVLSAVLVLVLLALLTWRWIRRLPRDARATPPWRYGLYGLILAGGLAVALGLPEHVRQRSSAPRPQRMPEEARAASLSKDGRMQPPAPPPVPFSEKLFRKLTLAPWVDVECERQGRKDASCAPWVFLPQGIYLRSAEPEYMKRVRRDLPQQRWAIRASSDSAGMLATDNKALMSLALRGEDQMLLAGRLYRQAGPPLSDAPVNKVSSARMPILQSLEQLVHTPWVKVNRFNPGTQPESITFLPEGRFQASYREGNCVHEGSFQLRGEQFSIDWGDNPCTLGVKGPARFESPPSPGWFLGELLLLKDAYRPQSAPATPPLTITGNPGWHLFLKGQLSSELRKGVPTELLLTLQRTRSAGELGISELWVWLRQRPSKDEEPKPRKEQVLFAKNLGGQLADALTGQFSERVILTPEFSGPAELEFEVTFSNDWASKSRLHQVYATEVGE